MSERQYGVDRKTLEQWIEKARNGETDMLIHGIQKTMECQERYVMVAEWLLTGMRRDTILGGGRTNIANCIEQQMPDGAAVKEDETYIDEAIESAEAFLRENIAKFTDRERAEANIRLLTEANRLRNFNRENSKALAFLRAKPDTQTNNERIES